MAGTNGNGHDQENPISTKNTTTLPKPDINRRRDNRNESGVVRLAGDSSIEREFITAGYSPEDTIAKTKLVDFNELNDLARYYDWCTDFEDTEALNVLNFWMNGKRSIGGFSFIHALFAKVGIVSPEALGVKMSKSEAETIKKFQEQRNRNRNDNTDNKEDNNP
jgi:hypothetical protein